MPNLFERLIELEKVVNYRESPPLGISAFQIELTSAIRIVCQTMAGLIIIVVILLEFRQLVRDLSR